MRFRPVKVGERSVSEIDVVVRSLERRLADLEKQVSDLNEKPVSASSKSPISCNHANEMPVQCPCDDDCYCKQHSCKNR